MSNTPSLYAELEKGLPSNHPSSENFDPLLYHPEASEYISKERSPLPHLDGFTQEELSSTPGMEWIGHCKMVLLEPRSDCLIEQKEQLDGLIEQAKKEATYLVGDSISGDFFPEGFNEPVMAIDTETTGLDTRIIYDYSGKLVPKVEIAGLCLSWALDEGYYLPILHTGDDGVPNWNKEAIRHFLERCSQEFLCVYHNAQYDREIISQTGAKQRPFPYFVDTQILDFLLNVNEKRHGLKAVSERHLGRKMVTIESLFANLGVKQAKAKTVINFDRISAKMAFVYGCSDAINTLRLFEFYLGHKENPIVVQPVPASIDHKLSDTLRTTYRTGLPFKLRFAYYAALECLYLLHRIEDRINEFCGRQVDIASPKQLSELLFDEFKIPPLEGEERGKMGYYSTKENVLDALYKKHSNYPILELVVLHRKVKNSMTKFHFKIVNNSYSCPFIPWAHGGMSFSITNAPTGRLSSSSNKGLERVYIERTKKGNLSKKYLTGAGDCAFNTHGVTVQYINMEKGKEITKMPSMLKDWLASVGGQEDTSVHEVDIYPKYIRNMFATELNK